MKTPIIPPYEPETGITQSPPQAGHRRPERGLYAVWEDRIEGLYLPQALEIVREMWAVHSVENIATVISRRTGYSCSPKLVWGLKARLDTAERNARE